MIAVGYYGTIYGFVEIFWSIQGDLLAHFVQYSTVVYSGVQYCTVLYSIVQYCIVLYSIVQYLCMMERNEQRFI